MKNIFNSFITAVLFLAANFASAQTYQLLPDSNASWLVQDRNSEYTLYHRYFLSETLNDTLINERTYTKIFSETNGTNIQYEGAFRNDVSGKTYFLPIDDTLQQEFILQDFTKEAGDTVFNVAIHYGVYRGSYDFVVDSVRYYPCGPYTLKSVSLHTLEEIPSIGNFMLITWLEKIGNVYGGIFNSPHGGLNMYRLICHNASDTILYSTPIFDFLPFEDYMVYRQGSCEYYLLAKELVKTSDFTIYPNPFTQTVTISTANYYRNIELQVYDIMGRIVFAGNIPVFSNNYTVSFPSSLPNGTYVLVINNKSKRLWKQIITKSK